MGNDPAVDDPSAEYLAAYARDYDITPPISLGAILKSSWLIEQMDRRGIQTKNGKQELN